MRKLVFVAAVIFSQHVGFAQQKLLFTLSDIIQKAQSESPGYKLASTKKEISYYQFLTYKSDFKPQVSFYGNLPVFNKEYFGVRQPDGTIIYQAISQNNSNVGFSLGQKIPFTGGELSLNTELARFDDFKAKTRQYNGTPVFLRLSQPLFAVNELKWKKIIEPLKFEESQKTFVQELENIAQQGVKLYFDVLDAQNNIEIASGNLQVTQINFETEKKRINLGTTTEDKLLQLELQTLRLRQEIEKAQYDYQVAQLALRTYIGLKEESELILQEPLKIPSLNVDLGIALDQALFNRPEYISFERKKKEAERDLALAKAEKQQVNLVASYGINSAGNELSNVFRNANDQQKFSIGFTIPVVDWGRRKARFNTAKAIEKLTQTTNEFDEATFKQEITTLVKNIELLKSSIELAQKTDSLAKRRFSIATRLYQVGKLSLTDLSLAQSEKDNTRRSFIGTLRSFWNAYYLLRRLTLYDFENKQKLINK